MGLPSADRTWEYKQNQTVTPGASFTASARTIWRGIKNAMINSGSSTFTTPWTVVSSSDSSTSGSSDLWAADSNLVANNNGSAHSWIVLKQTGISSNFQLLISYNTNGNGAAYERLTFAVSQSVGFSGGSSTSDPTASDSVTLYQGIWSWGTSNANNANWNVYGSSDGKDWRIFITWQNKVTTAVFVGVPTNAHSSWTGTDLWWGWAKGANATADVPTIANLHSAAGFVGRISSNNTTFYLTQMTYNGTRVGASGSTGLPNGFASEYPIIKPYLLSTQALSAGPIGTPADIYWSSETFATGDTLPNDGTKTWVMLGNIMIKNNGSSVTII